MDFFCWRPAGFLLFCAAMKKFCLTLLTAAILAASLSANAAESKVATVDMKKLFNGYYKTKLAQSSLETRKTDLRKEIKDMADGLEKAQTDYKQLLDQANDQALSADERDKRKSAAADKAKEIAGSRSAIEQFQRQAESQLADQSQRMSGNLVTEIQKAVSDKAKAGGFTVVLNSGSNEVVVFASDASDITASVLAQLNAGQPVDVIPTSGVPLNISTNL
jgi:Skp family chaperone for outer membrane proteins